MHDSVSIAIRPLLAAIVVAGFARPSFADEAVPAADHSAVLAPFVNDDTFFVSYADMAAMAPPENRGELLRLMAHAPPEVQNRLLGIMIIGGLVQRYQEAGGQGLYMLAGLEDLNAFGGPVLIATAAPGKRLDGVEQLVRDVIQEISANPSQIALLPVTPLLKTRRAGDVLLVGTESVVERYATLAATARGDLVDPLTKMSADGAMLAAVFSPGPDFRRVVRELWPAFPEPLAAWTGELADRWLRLEFAAKVQAKPSAELVMQATDPASAELFVELLRALPAASEQFMEIGEKRLDLQRALQTIVDAVPTQINRSRVVMSLPTDGVQLAKLQGLLGEASDAAMESTRRHQRIQQFKQLALAMHSYADKYNHLPPPAIRGNDGRPLLSWRVAILPWIEERKLFDQFHLDEPWDSPHNLALAKQMPAIYADPAIANLAREGKTTYVVPVGPGTVFDSETGIIFREITDGSSSTVMILEVPPEGAVIWTNPEDWEVDMRSPLQGIERTDRDYITAAWCDGRGSLIPTSTDPAKFRSILTRAGGEVVDWP